jgi:hypothetical protein
VPSANHHVTLTPFGCFFLVCFMFPNRSLPCSHKVYNGLPVENAFAMCELCTWVFVFLSGRETGLKEMVPSHTFNPSYSVLRSQASPANRETPSQPIKSWGW